MKEISYVRLVRQERPSVVCSKLEIHLKTAAFPPTVPLFHYFLKGFINNNGRFE